MSESRLDKLCSRRRELLAQITEWCHQYGRPADSVRLLAVSKHFPVADIEALNSCGQVCFGESYLSEAADKIDHLAGLNLDWHYIGPLQSNKTRRIAERFTWVQSLDRDRIAHRLAEQRPADAPPLNVCLQVRLSDETTKAGVEPAALPELAGTVARLPGLRLRGLMSIPAPTMHFGEQREAFARLRRAYEALQAAGHDLDTLSMGMTGDLEAAIAEGSTLVRIGTGLFGRRPGRPTGDTAA